MGKTDSVDLSRIRHRAKRDWLLLCGVQSFYWVTMTLHSSFLVFYLNKCNYPTTLIASLTLSMTVVNLFAQPIWGYIADAMIGIKRALMICFLGSIPVLLLLPVFVKYIWMTVLLNIIYAVFNYPLQGLTDSITSIAAERNQFVSYGFTRGCGSFSSAVVSLIVGYILDSTRTEILFTIEAVLLFLALLFTWWYKDTIYGKETAPAREAGRNRVLPAIKKLLKNPVYLLLILSITLMNTGNRTTLFFVPILIEEFGGNNAHLGWCLFLNCLLMAPCMVLHSHMIKRGVKNHVPLLIGAGFGIVRVLLMQLARSLQVLIPLQILQSFAYGFLQPSTVQAAGDSAEFEIRSTAISLAIAATTVFSTFIGQIGGSYLSGIIGIYPTFAVSAAGTFLGIVCYLPVIWKERRENL